MGVSTSASGDREYIVEVRGGVVAADVQQALAELDSDMELQSFRVGFTAPADTAVELLSDELKTRLSGGEIELSDSGTRGADGQSESSDGSTTGDTGDADTVSGVGDDPVLSDLDPDQLNQEPEEIEYSYTTLQKVAAKEGIKGNMKQEKIVAALREKVAESDSRVGRGSQSLPLRPGHDPFYVMAILNDSDGWMRTTDIRQAVQDEWGVNKDTVVNTLWHLTQRDLVETQQYTEDKRQKQYALTTKGESVIGEMLAYAEEEGQRPEITIEA